jgi:hypothetical protein
MFFSKLFNPILDTWSTTKKLVSKSCLLVQWGAESPLQLILAQLQVEQVKLWLWQLGKLRQLWIDHQSQAQCQSILLKNIGNIGKIVCDNECTGGYPAFAQGSRYKTLIYLFTFSSAHAWRLSSLCPGSSLKLLFTAYLFICTRMEAIQPLPWFQV